MSNGHNIPPFFKRRIDHHKFEKMMRKGISYMYYESQNVVEFKYKLVFATLENYLHDKYNIELTDVPSEDVVSFVEYMIDTYDPLLAQYYYNMRREGRGSVNEGTMDNTIQKIIDASVKEIIDMCNDFDRLTFPNYMSFESCEYIDLISKITVKKITTIKKLSNLPMFDVEIDIDYNSALESVDFDEELTLITDHIKNKYKIFLVFTIMEQNNLHDRQMESIKPLIKKVLREETEEDKKYLQKIKYELDDNYWRVKSKFDQKWLKDSNIQWVFYDEGREIFEVEIKSDRNWELTWWIQFDKNMNMESVIRHETKEWEYNIKDVEEIGGFEGYSKEFWSVIKFIYPYAQKFIIRKRKESLNENIEEPLKKFLNKFWDSKKDQGEIPMIKYSFLRKLGLLGKKDEIGNYYIEYMGGKDEVYGELNNYLIGNEFTTSDIKNEGIQVGGYDFTFKVIDFGIINLHDQPEAFVKTKILRGTVDTGDGEHYDLADNDSIPEDLWWEIENELRDLIADFTYKIIYSFGFNVDDLFLEWD
jgi:hypothetical protein